MGGGRGNVCRYGACSRSKINARNESFFCFFGRRKLLRRVGRVGDLVESSSAAASYVCSGGAPETVQTPGSVAELEHAACYGAAARSPTRNGGEADRQHRLHPKKLCQAWQSFPSTPLAKRRPAGYPNHTYAICMLCTYLPSLPPLLITVTFCDFNLPRSTEAIWGQFKMPLKVIFSQVSPKVPIELELRIGISEQNGGLGTRHRAQAHKAALLHPINYVPPECRKELRSIRGEGSFITSKYVFDLQLVGKFSGRRVWKHTSIAESSSQLKGGEMYREQLRTEKMGNLQ